MQSAVKNWNQTVRLAFTVQTVENQKVDKIR